MVLRSTISGGRARPAGGSHGHRARAAVLKPAGPPRRGFGGGRRIPSYARRAMRPSAGRGRAVVSLINRGWDIQPGRWGVLELQTSDGMAGLEYATAHGLVKSDPLASHRSASRLISCAIGTLNGVAVEPVGPRWLSLSYPCICGAA